MKLFHCARCEADGERAYPLEIKGTVSLNDYLQKGAASETSETWYLETSVAFQADEIANPTCSLCDNPVELIEIEDCPHDWEDIAIAGLRQRCHLCGKQRQGKVMYD